MTKRVAREAAQVIGKQVDEDEAEDVEGRGMEEAIKDFADGERYIKLYRHPDKILGGRPKLLGPLSREDFNDVTIQERFGGGSYFGRWKTKTGAYTRFNFEIDGEPKVFTEKQQEQMEREDREEREAPYGFLKRPGEPSPQVAPMGIAEVLQIIAETRRESREEVRMILEMARPPAAPPNATEQVFSLVKELIPLLNTGGGVETGTGNALIDGFIKLKDPIMKMLETAQIALTRPAQPAAGPIGAPAPTDKRIAQPPAPAPIPEPTPPAPVPKTEEEMLVESFRPYLGLLMDAASERKDVGLYVDLILDRIPPFAYDRLRTWLNKPGCLDDLAKLDAGLYAQRAWWEALRATLIGALNEELGDAPRNLQPVPNSNPPADSPADSA